MITVVAIIGVLALVTVPAFMNFRNSAKMRSSVSSFTTDLRSARQRAITKAHQVIVTYEVTGAGAQPKDYKRRYYFYEGNLPFGSTTWTPVAITAAGASAKMHTLDDIIYFPANAASTPQTFDDTLTCAPGSCTTGPDANPEVVFFPDGHVTVPSGALLGQITIKTDLNRIAHSQYRIDISPSGNIKAVAQ
jgi:Tfp pilus assembly protein FimT